MPTKLCAVVAIWLVTLSNHAFANPYDDCILQHVGTAQDKTAVYAIERACINKTSVTIFPDGSFAGGLDAVVGEFNIGGFNGPEFGLVVTMKNTTKYDITEVSVTIKDKATREISRYPVTEFNAPLPPGTLLTGLGEPALTQIIKSGETRRFFIHVNESSARPSDFGNKFGWGVLPTKGIPGS